MANTSIYNAFERMWQHIVAKLEKYQERTHWVEGADVVLFDGSVNIKNIAAVRHLEPAFSFAMGKKYTVTLDGITYEAESWTDQYGCVCIGAPYIDGAFDYSEFPFYAGSYYDDGLLICEFNCNTKGDHTLVIVENETVHKIDHKFLPEGVGYDGKGYKLVSFSTETVDDITVAERFTPNVIIVPGNKYRITVGDNAYELMAYVDTNGFLTIGAPVASSGTGWDFSQIPVSLYNNATGNTYFAYNTLGTYDILVEEEIDVAYKIDSKYLPTQDWNADDASSGHIKNRTHYTEIVGENVLLDATGYFSTYQNGGYYNTSIDINNATLVLGNSYRVIWDGVEYICVCAIDDVMSGLEYIGGYCDDDTEEYTFTEFPFTFVASERIYSKTSGYHTLIISEIETVIHRLDEKYLPLLTSPNGTKYLLSVANDGTITTTAVT